MKFLILVFALCVASVLGGLTEEQKKQMKEHKKACTDETKVDPSMLEHATNAKTFPDGKDEKFKCYCKCLLKKMGVMNADGTFNDEGFHKSMPADVPKEKVEAVHEKCKGEKGDNECDTGYKLLKCFMEKKDFEWK